MSERKAAIRSAAFEREAIRLMAQHAQRVGIREEWLHEDDETEGIHIRLSNESHDVLSYPPESNDSSALGQLLLCLNAKSAIVTHPSSIELLYQHYDKEENLRLTTGERISIFQRLSAVSNVTSRCGCFLLREPAVAVSYGSVTESLEIARQVDSRLVGALFQIALPEASGPLNFPPPQTPHQLQDEFGTSPSILPQSTRHHSSSASHVVTDQGSSQSDPKLETQLVSKDLYKPDAQQLSWLETLPKSEAVPEENEKEGKENLVAEVVTTDHETGETILEQGRTAMYIAPLLIGLALAVNFVITSLFVRDIILETLVDFQFSRILLLIAAIPRFFVSQFFCEHVVLTFAQLLFPVSHMHRNSLFYSSQKSKALDKTHTLPHFTIQMPCYKEGLQSVLAPSLQSVYEAVVAYRRQGGTANIVISEDGLRLLDKDEAEERIRFYKSLGCGWIARPAHGENGYERRGRFKKASNLNYSYSLSTKVEEAMKAAAKGDGLEHPTEDMHDAALDSVLARQDNTAWACGDIRIGDYILLIDSDTRVPVDCLMDAANEMERSPDVAALQHCSGITYVQHHYFERLLGYFVGVFTNFSISWVCANGASAPLMGHNVFLRWSALQQVQDGIDDQGEQTIFSSKHVSEDYELAMRLQMSGYCVRWATYSNQEFKEGVSLNPNDEKARWQKYAFGACEIVFNPLYKWFMGPLSPLFWRYLLNRKVHASAKAAAVSYLSSYFAIAVSLPITIGLTAAQGLFWPTLDPVFKPVFDTWIAVVFVFNVAGTLGLILCRSRSGHQSFLRSTWEGVQHLPAIVIFFMGIAYHLFCSVMAFFLSIKMTWGATSKDYQQTTLTQVIRRFWHCYLTMTFLFVAAVVSISPLVPLAWRIEGFTILFPLFLSIALHFLFPIILDPGMLHKFLPRYYATRVQEQKMEKPHDFFFAAKDDESSFDKDSRRVPSSKSSLSKLSGGSTSTSSISGGQYVLPYSQQQSTQLGMATPRSFAAPYSPAAHEVATPSLPRMPSTSYFSPAHSLPRAISFSASHPVNSSHCI